MRLQGMKVRWTRELILCGSCVQIKETDGSFGFVALRFGRQRIACAYFTNRWAAEEDQEEWEKSEPICSRVNMQSGGGQRYWGYRIL